MLRIESTDHDRCCGCTACVSVCGTHALQMEPDAYGFSYPRIDNDLCVGCGRCTRVCPTMAADAQRDLKLRQCMRSVVALASDPTELVTSTSGGMASVLARTFIRQLRGVVYGASAADPYHVRHVRIDREDQVSQLKGSKYVQSDMEGIIPQIKMDLKDCRNVLFVGTPCQCAGVQLCFPNHGGRLWLVDFVCHGVPSQQMLNDAYKELGVDVGSVAFRRKDAGGKSEYGLFLRDKEGRLCYEGLYGYDRYITSFLKGLNYRESCYNCRFANHRRASDITLGDYWNPDGKYSHLPGSRFGLSQVHANSEHGEALLNIAAEAYHSEQIPISQLLAHSEQLRKPITPHPESQLFFSTYMQGKSFIESCDTALEPFFRRYPFYRLKCALRQLPRLVWDYVHAVPQFFKKNTP